MNWEIMDLVHDDQVLTSMALFWALMLLSYFLMQNGLSIFNDVTKAMSLFMLEKALGPGIDLVEGREGSASKAWFIQGMLWLIAAATLTFEGLWLKHDALALHSLSAWGYDPTAYSLLYASNYAALYGGIGMLLIGSSLHIMPRLAGTQLASERNATLVSFLWTLSVLVLVVAAHDSEILGINVFLVGSGMHILAFLAILMNLLLTVSERQTALPIPGWLIILGILADPVSAVTVIITGGISTGAGQWLLTHMVGGTFFFATAAGVALYCSSSASGNTLWSRSLGAATLVGAMATINPMGDTNGWMAADMLGASREVFLVTSTDSIALAFLMALGIIPVMALAANVLMTLRGGDAFVENPDSAGIAELNLGASLVLPLAIISLFMQVDMFSLDNDVSLGISDTLLQMAIWLVLVPLSLGAALHLFPAVTGRHLMSPNRSRRAYWIMGGGAFLGLTISMMADLTHVGLVEAYREGGIGIETIFATDEGHLPYGGLAADIQAVGAVLFYGAVVGAIMHTLNAVSGLFRGARTDTERATSSSITTEAYSLASPTSVRKILAGGASLDTTVVPSGESDDAGSATEL